MKREISSIGFASSRLLFICIIFWIITIGIYIERTKLITVIFSNDFPLLLLAALIGIIVVSLIYYYKYARFYRVELDAEKLYYYGLFSKGEIPLASLIAADNGLIPIRYSYSVIIHYYDENNNRKKIRFLSKEISNSVGPWEIKELIELREIIDKKEMEKITT